MMTTIEINSVELDIDYTHHAYEEDTNYGGFYTIDRIFYDGMDIEPILRKEKKTDFNYEDGTLFFGSKDISGIWNLLEGQKDPFSYVEDEFNTILDDENF